MDVISLACGTVTVFSAYRRRLFVGQANDPVIRYGTDAEIVLVLDAVHIYTYVLQRCEI